MSRGGEVGPVRWGDRFVTLRLGTGEWRKIQERCDAGPYEIGQRLYLVAQGLRREVAKITDLMAIGVTAGFRIDDVREVLLRALIGGGMSEHDAATIVIERIDEQQDFKNGILLAYAAVEATLDEPSDDPLGERQAGAGKPKRRSRAAKSASPTSTASLPQ